MRKTISRLIRNGSDVPCRTQSSKAHLILGKSVRQQLLSRPANLIYDHISPTPSHLLNLSLADLLSNLPATPDFCLPPTPDQAPLPLGHHLVYFPAPIKTNALLSDGTDTLHWPGEPWVRRLWAGGEITFWRPIFQQPHVRMACEEKITRVRISGDEGREKIFIEISRRIFNPSLDIPSSASCLEEKRNLVFMKRESQHGKSIVQRSNVRTRRDPPDYCVSFTPTRSLLFRFSALTFNAHRIHLDSGYSIAMEQLEDKVVHGPLTVVLMLAVLQSQLPEDVCITNFFYRNLSPLYVNREMQICIRKKNPTCYEVWIEGAPGRFDTKGTATVDTKGG